MPPTALSWSACPISAIFLPRSLIHRNLGPLPRDDAGADRRLIAVDGVLEDRGLFAVVARDLGDRLAEQCRKRLAASLGGFLVKASCTCCSLGMRGITRTMGLCCMRGACRWL